MRTLARSQKGVRDSCPPARKADGMRGGLSPAPRNRPPGASANPLPSTYRPLRIIRWRGEWFGFTAMTTSDIIANL